jgi:hypothetical protein
VAVNIDALPPVSMDTGWTAAQETMDLVERFCGGGIALYRLDASGGSFEV